MTMKGKMKAISIAAIPRLSLQKRPREVDICRNAPVIGLRILVMFFLPDPIAYDVDPNGSLRNAAPAVRRRRPPVRLESWLKPGRNSFHS
jgi:hypothetical protein